MQGVRHPARHYIFYLLSKQIHDVKAVFKRLEALGIPVPHQDWDFSFERLCTEILSVKATMVFPQGFAPKDKILNQPTLTFLRHWKLHDVWRRSPYVGAAIELLAEPNIRHLLELLILGPLSAGAIAERLKGRFDLSDTAMNSAVVRAYAHYFWDPNAMSPAEWQKWLESYYKDTKDEFLAALNAPRSAAGAAFVIALADKDPQLLSAAERYETASTMAFGMLMRHAMNSERSTSHTYAAFTALNMMRMADEELSKHRGGSSDLLSELQRLKPVYDEQPPLQITQALYIQRPALEAKNDEVIDAPTE